MPNHSAYIATRGKQHGAIKADAELEAARLLETRYHQALLTIFIGSYHYLKTFQDIKPCFHLLAVRGVGFHFILYKVDILRNDGIHDPSDMMTFAL